MNIFQYVNLIYRTKKFGRLIDKMSSKHIHHQSPIPFRWAINYLGGIGSDCLVKAIDLDENRNYGFKYKIYSTTWKFTDFFSSKWGTYYTVNLDKWKDKMDGEGWDDYDSDGLPYWEDFWNEDPVTGDGWRLLRK